MYPSSKELADQCRKALEATRVSPKEHFQQLLEAGFVNYQGEVTSLICGGRDNPVKPEIQELIKVLVRDLGCRPTGSRYVGGFTDKSDWDFYVVETPEVIDKLLHRGYHCNKNEADYTNGEFNSWRHAVCHINVMTMSAEYYAVYDYANEQVKNCGELLLTRNDRIAMYDKFEEQYRMMVESGWKWEPVTETVIPDRAQADLQSESGPPDG